MHTPCVGARHRTVTIITMVGMLVVGLFIVLSPGLPAARAQAVASTVGDDVAAWPQPWAEWTKYAGNPVLADTSVNATIVKSILTDADDPLKRPLLFPHPTAGDCYWMAYANLGWGGTIRLAYSTDLLHWTPYRGNPVLALSTGEYYLSSPHLFRDGDDYFMVYDVSMASPHGEAQRIAYATAPSPLGPWTKGPLILDLGVAGAWDEGRVTEPHVLKDGDTYYLYYMGDLLPPYAQGEQVGVATTPASSFPRGPWTKHGVVLPIRKSVTAWDRGLTADPALIKVDDLYYMLYTGSTGDNSWRLGIAWATHPLGPWQRPAQPSLTTGPAPWDSIALVRGMITWRDGTFYLYYAGHDGARFRSGVALASQQLIASPTPTEAVTRTPTPSPTPTATPPPYVAAVNAGAGRYVDSQGAIWQADRPFSAGSWGFVGGSTYAIDRTIKGTDDQALYQSEHWGMSGYSFTVPDGVYDVELHFAEIYCRVANCRVFDVLLENSLVLGSLDIYRLVGRDTAYVRRFTVTVSDGVLDVTFRERVSAAKLNALRIWPHDAQPTATGTSTASPTPGAATSTPTATSTATATFPTSTPTATSTATATFSTSTPTATSTARSTRLINTPTAIGATNPHVQRVNCGGGAYTDAEGNRWAGDRPFVAGAWGHVGGQVSTTTQPITGTSDQLPYQAQLYNMTAYRFTVAPGRYRVTLRFAETYAYAHAGGRVFSVKIEGVAVLPRLDILALANRYRALDYSFETVVGDGVLAIDFAPVTGPPTIGAIEIMAIGP